MATQPLSTAVEQATLVAGSVSTGAVVVAFPEHWPILLISGFVAGLLRVFRILRLPATGGLKSRVMEAASAMLLSMSSAWFLWPAGQPTLEPWLGQIAVEGVNAIWFGSFSAGLVGTVLIGGILDWRMPTPPKEDEDA